LISREKEQHEKPGEFSDENEKDTHRGPKMTITCGG
jgi:hypothetical protein